MKCSNISGINELTGKIVFCDKEVEYVLNGTGACPDCAAEIAQLAIYKMAMAQQQQQEKEKITVPNKGLFVPR